MLNVNTSGGFGLQQFEEVGRVEKGLDMADWLLSALRTALASDNIR